MKLNINFAIAIVFLVAIVVYFGTVTPSVTFTDSGELSEACSTLGISHPTGYPLFTMLGYLWTLLPLPLSNVYKLNLLASIWTALSAVVFFTWIRDLSAHLCREIKREQINKKKKIKPEYVSLLSDEDLVNKLSLVLAITYAFALTIWAQAVAIEVYSLQLLIFNLLIFLLLRSYINISNNFYLLATAFIFGLGFANHMTTVLLVPGGILLFYNIFRERRTNQPSPSVKSEHASRRKQLSFSSLISYMGALFLSGLALYIYLPLRSAALPAFNWGWVHRSFDKFIYHVQGKQYQGWMFSDLEAFFANIGEFIQELPFQFGIVGLILVLAGFFMVHKTNMRAVYVFFAVNVLACIIYASNYSIHDIQAYYALAVISLFPFAIVASADLLKRNKNLVYALLLIPILNFALNLKTNDKSGDYLVHEYTTTLVNGLGKDAIIISAQWDYWNSAFIYFREVEGMRSDVWWIGKELMRRTWYPLQLQRWHPTIFDEAKNELKTYSEDLERFESGLPPNSYPFIQQNFVALFRKIIESNIDKKPVYITLDILKTEEDMIRGYEVVPEGLAIRLYRPGTVPTDVRFEIPDLERFIESSNVTKSSIGHSLVEVVSHSVFSLGQFESLYQRMDNAKKAYEYALKINPNNPDAQKALVNLNSR
jgi:tetratricopeptide (TPR) repeat protein